LVRVFVCDSHAILRAGIRSILDEESNCEIVGEASYGSDAARLAASLRPDVLLLGLSLADMHGLEAMRLIQKASPATRILILSLYEEEDTIANCIKAGAAGFLPKGAPVSQLLNAIHSAHAGAVSNSRATKETRTRSSPARGERLAKTLSAREQEVLVLLSEGHSYKEIGARLHLSVKTVDTHKYNLMRKLNIHSRAGLIRFAIRERLVDA
jgi:two-component system response regulator NreC